MAKGSSRTSVVLDRELRSKLFMLAQALDTDMGDIIRRAIRVFYEYTRRYARDKGNDRILEILDLAERKDLWAPEAEAKAKDVEEYALGKIREGEKLPPEKTGLE